PRLAASLAETVERATLNGDREFRLALNPPDLGQLTVRVTEHADGGVSISMSFSAPPRSVSAHGPLRETPSSPWRS
ncbi:MAG: hypothetical protein ABL993_04695, partial [Vicinamibacterales bacterium]